MKPRITDVDVRKPSLITAEEIARDVEKFLAKGGQIETPEFRRDRLQVTPGRENATRRRWQIHSAPPDLKEFQRGATKK